MMAKIQKQPNVPSLKIGACAAAICLVVSVLCYGVALWLSYEGPVRAYAAGFSVFALVIIATLIPIVLIPPSAMFILQKKLIPNINSSWAVMELIIMIVIQAFGAGVILLSAVVITSVHGFSSLTDPFIAFSQLFVLWSVLFGGLYGGLSRQRGVTLARR